MRVSILLLIASTPLLGAQQLSLQCVGQTPSPCLGEIAPSDSVQRFPIRLRLLDGTTPVSGALIQLRATSGSIAGDTLRTDVAGEIVAEWIREGGATQVGIAASASAATGTAAQSIVLRPRKAVRPTLLIDSWHGDEQSWFEKTTLPDVVDIHIRKRVGTEAVEITDPAECAAQRVHFARYAGAGSVAPDTAVGSVWEMDDGRLGCFAWTRWTLGDGPGTRELRISGISSSGLGAPAPLEISARARPLPRFIAGFARFPMKEYVGVKAGTQRTIRVERPDGGGTIAYDSVVTSASAPNRIKGASSFEAIAGLTVAIPSKWLAASDWDVFAASVGVNLRAPRDEWFIGIPALRLFTKEENLPFDILVIGMFARRIELVDEQECANTGVCRTDAKRSFQGVGFVLSADASTVVAEVMKRLAP